MCQNYCGWLKTRFSLIYYSYHVYCIVSLSTAVYMLYWSKFQVLLHGNRFVFCGVWQRYSRWANHMHAIKIVNNSTRAICTAFTSTWFSNLYEKLELYTYMNQNTCIPDAQRRLDTLLIDHVVCIFADSFQYIFIWTSLIAVFSML